MPKYLGGFMYYVVYFLESTSYPHRHYIGYTTNLKNRIKYHNQGLVTSTKNFKPWKIIYAEMYLDKKDAMGREKFLKSGSGWKFLKKQLTHYFDKNICVYPVKNVQKNPLSPIIEKIRK
ncbi:MAG: GIY-YIG nuclease family protein [Candidatus Magasanikbacteria bacterium]